MTKTAILKQNILKLADHCVKCGLCSTQCPTYALNQDENESPRGRIALAQALASDAIPAAGKVTQHLQNCLQCRRCESACPSEVKYGELITLSTALINQQLDKQSAILSHQNLNRQIVNRVSKLTHLHWLKVAKVYRFTISSGLIQLFRLKRSGKNLLDLIPNDQIFPASKKTTTTTTKKGSVLLFTGCLSHLLDKQSMDATVNLLQCCGYKVKIPQNQTCCGAIADRQGETGLSQHCQSNNQIAFSDSNNTPIIFFTTGCGAKLKEYKENLPAGVGFSDRTFDISDFLNKSELFSKLQFSPLNKKVLIFNPCSERNMLKQFNVADKLLERIPGIEIINLQKSTGCCGASGTHLLTHQQQAKQIREPILDQIIRLAPDIIVSPNYPCNLHIQSGLNEKGLDIPMIHPIQLLLNQVTIPE